MIQTKENMEKAEKYLKVHNATVNCLDENKKNQVKYTQDLERYKFIMNYFEKNPSMKFAGKNMIYLDRIDDSLIKFSPGKVDVSDEDIQEKVRMICLDKEYKELANKLEDMTIDSTIKKITKLKKELSKIGGI